MNTESEEKALSLFDSLKSARTQVNKHSSEFIGKKDFLKLTGNSAKEWFHVLRPELVKVGMDLSLLSKYDACFNQLLKLSSGNNRTSSFKSCLRELLQSFHEDIVLKVQTTRAEDHHVSEFADLLDKVKDHAENEYLSEAIGCLNAHFHKASVVLGWCACIHKIHAKIEAMGYSVFNSTSLNLANQTAGRFKRFNKKYNVSSASELREVFDNDVLWIIEGMGLIDLNEHTRLKGCFDMRNHSAHPGNAPITKYNILSFFSDIIEIVLTNPKFS